MFDGENFMPAKISRYAVGACLGQYGISSSAKKWGRAVKRRRCLFKVHFKVHFCPIVRDGHHVGLDHTYYVEGISTTEAWRPQTGSI